jgi:hypothetical protein
MIKKTTTTEMVNTPFSLSSLNSLEKELTIYDNHLKKIKYISLLFFVVITYFGLDYLWTSEFVTNYYLHGRTMPTEKVHAMLVDYKIGKTKTSFSIFYLFFTVGISLLFAIGLHKLFLKHVDLYIDDNSIMLTKKDLQPAQKIDQKIIMQNTDVSTMYQNILNQGRDVRKFEYDLMKRLARKRNWLS